MSQMYQFFVAKCPESTKENRGIGLKIRLKNAIIKPTAKEATVFFCGADWNFLYGAATDMVNSCKNDFKF